MTTPERRTKFRTNFVILAAIAAVLTGPAAPAVALSEKGIERELNKLFGGEQQPDSDGFTEGYGDGDGDGEQRGRGAPSLPSTPRRMKALTRETTTVWPIVEDIVQTKWMILWGRHSPKFVKFGGTKYVVLMGEDQRPAIYARSLKSGNGWRAIWRGASKAHQPPSLLVDKEGRLHLLFVNPQGYLRHSLFQIEASGAIRYLGQVPSRRWGGGNFYMGAAYIRDAGTVAVCATHFATRSFRCSGIERGQWARPHIVANGMLGEYLYPNIQPTGDTALVATALYKPGMPFGSRSLNNLFAISARGEALRDGRNVTYGNASTGAVYFENDIAADNQGHVSLLISRVIHKVGAIVPPEALILKSGEGFARRHLIPNIDGGSQTLMATREAEHVIGGGVHSESRDGGESWTNSKIDLPGFPHEKYSYGVAQGLQDRSGSEYEGKGISFLQELVDRKSQSRSVVEVDIENGETAIVAAPAFKPRPVAAAKKLHAGAKVTGGKAGGRAVKAQVRRNRGPL